MIRVSRTALSFGEGTSSKWQTLEKYCLRNTSIVFPWFIVLFFISLAFFILSSSLSVLSLHFFLASFFLYLFSLFICFTLYNPVLFSFFIFTSSSLFIFLPPSYPLVLCAYISRFYFFSSFHYYLPFAVFLFFSSFLYICIWLCSYSYLHHFFLYLLPSLYLPCFFFLFSPLFVPLASIFYLLFFLSLLSHSSAAFSSTDSELLQDVPILLSSEGQKLRATASCYHPDTAWLTDGHGVCLRHCGRWMEPPELMAPPPTNGVLTNL